MMRRGLTLSLTLCFAALSASAAPTASLHEIKWFVHTDLVTGGEDLAFWEGVLDAALDDAQVLALEGHGGPADTTCCSKLEKEEHSPGITLTAFGTGGDGYDVMDGLHPFNDYRSFGGTGSRGFIIDSILDCGGSGAIGCADLPACDSTPDDDPDLVLVVTRDAEDSGVLGLVIAHERGHTACLVHVATNNCELMRAAVNGGCLSSSECDDFDDARQTTGGTCVCHADAPAGTALDDGTACVDGAITGQCSGGVCGATPGDASAELFASGGPGFSTGATTDDPLRQSTVPGGWEDLGSFTGSATIRGLAYDVDAAVLYGVRDVAAADDEVLVVDPATGATSAAMTVTGHADLIALAFDPGATSGTGDDRLLALSQDASFAGFEDLIVIDPSDGSSTTLGTVDVGVSGGFTGLAYDDVNDVLYGAAFAGGSLWTIQDTGCGGVPVLCTGTEVVAVSLPRIEPSLAFSRDSGNLYMLGGQSGDRTLYNSITPVTFTTTGTVGIDRYTAGGLSAIPLPEPAAGLALSAGAALIAWLGHRRRRTAG